MVSVRTLKLCQNALDAPDLLQAKTRGFGPILTSLSTPLYNALFSIKSPFFLFLYGACHYRQQRSGGAAGLRKI
jgi:hypothetical protein